MTFEQGNNEEWGETRAYDMATVMYNFHEMPSEARRSVLRNAQRLARQSVLVVDIWPGFEPTPMMLSGEPYVLDYLQNVDDDIDESAGPGWTVSRVELVPGHVRMWRLDRDDDYARTELDWGI